MFPPMIVGALVGGAASAMSLLHHYRQQLGPMTVHEARLLASLPPTPIAHASSGFVKIVGRADGLSTITSFYHREPCVALRICHYEVVDTMSGPRRVLVREEENLAPFWVEDETGRVSIDPSSVRIDFEVEGGEYDSTMEEHRIRRGERVAILGYVERSGPKLTMPMRSAHTTEDSNFQLRSGALLTWRSEPEVYPKLQPPLSEIALSAGSAMLAALGAAISL